MNGLFSMQGRLGRGNYFLISVVAFLIYILVLFFVGLALGTALSEEELTMFSNFLMIPYIIVIAVAKVKRLHDLDRPGAHYWLQLIPIYGLYLELLLLLKPGTEGENRYGPGSAQPQTVSDEALAV